MALRPLPIGIDDFGDMIRDGYYYVDKSLFIKELWEKKGKVNLFTRPRRFGKTLTLNMLKRFFEDTGSEEENSRNRALFDGLAIMEAGDAVAAQRNKYPVISLSLKSARQPDKRLAFACLREEIEREYKRHLKAADSLALSADRRRFINMAEGQGREEDYVTALRFLSDCLYQAGGRRAVILLDEYDVPLENAYFNGFYKEMSDFIRSLFESALKGNPSLEFAVVTSCLRISKESIFTGLNNLNVVSILSDSYAEYFGFLEEEVERMLEDYGCEKSIDLMKKWYDGYCFGGREVYNPWSVVSYVNALAANPSAFPRPYWSNTSSNSIVKELVKRADLSVKQELEELEQGKSIEKPIHEDVTYDTMYESQDNLWNFLFFTGYLKMVSMRMEGNTAYASLAIPNAEIASIYENSIRSWFREEVGRRDLSRLYQALEAGDAPVFEEELSGLLRQTISFMDGRESFYHGFLLGVLGNMQDCLVKSNREAGNGRFDICVRSLDVSRPPAVLELKAAAVFGQMDALCQEALAQIEEKGYDSGLAEEGYGGVWHFGIAFFKKQCRVKTAYRPLSPYSKI